MAKIHFKGGSVVTMDPKVPNLEVGDVLVEDDKIAAVGVDLAVGDDAQVIDASGMIIMPGLVNAHIHTWQTGLRGIAGNWTGTNYFRAIHAGLALFFKPEDIYIANLVGALNQINSGVTTLVDWHHNNPTPDHSDAAIDGLEEAGVRALFLHGSAKPDAKPGQKHHSEIPMSRSEVERLRKGRLSGDNELLSMGLAVLGPQMSVNDVVLEDFRLAREFDLIASLHHSGAEMVGPQGYEYAAKEGLISDKINIVHGNALTDSDLKLLVDNGATFAVTAEVEMQMAYGDPLTGKLREFGVPVAIGSDVECVYAPDMFASMRITLQLERHEHSMRHYAQTGEKPHPIPVTTGEALSWATINGAKMAHLDSAIGSLTPGKQADITLLRKTDLNLAGISDATNRIVMHANPGNVDTVMIAGEIKKQNGQMKFDGVDAKIATLAKSSARILDEFKAKAPTADYL
ncbi:MAG: amidohydrolase family protein [Alphaproteobacteria bacterium]|nr:amidohydrolase family protein [Alphaproteobacteria bacterium]